MDAKLAGGTVAVAGAVTTLPEGFRAYAAAHPGAWCVRDNLWLLDGGGAVAVEPPERPAAPVAVRSALDVARERHERRTEAEAEGIRMAWKSSGLRANLAELSSRIKATMCEPMTHEAADKGRGNPRFAEGERQYQVNCQSCVVAYELRRCGLDVEAYGKVKGCAGEYLSYDTSLVWHPDDISPVCFGGLYTFEERRATGKTFMPKKEVLSRLEAAIGEGRYTVRIGWKNYTAAGHIINAERVDGKIRYFDPQSGETYSTAELFSHASLQKRIVVTRVDGARLSVDFASGVVKPSGSTSSTPLDGVQRYQRLKEARLAELIKRVGTEGRQASGDAPPPRTPLTEKQKTSSDNGNAVGKSELRQMRARIIEQARLLLSGQTVKTAGPLVTFSTRGIKEFVNQPWEDESYEAKNALALRLPDLLQTAEYLGVTKPHKGGATIKAMHVFRTTVQGKPAFLLACEDNEGVVRFYGVSQNERAVTEDIEKGST